MIATVLVYFGAVGLVFTGLAWLWDKWAARCDRQARRDARYMARQMRRAA